MTDRRTESSGTMMISTSLRDTAVANVAAVPQRQQLNDKKSDHLLSDTPNDSSSSSSSRSGSSGGTTSCVGGTTSSKCDTSSSSRRSGTSSSNCDTSSGIGSSNSCSTSSGSSSSSSTPMVEDKTIRFDREPNPAEDRKIADVLRVRLGIEQHVKLLKELRPERVDEIRKYEDRWFEVNATYISLVEQRSGILGASSTWTNNSVPSEIIQPPMKRGRSMDDGTTGGSSATSKETLTIADKPSKKLSRSNDLFISANGDMVDPEIVRAMHETIENDKVDEACNSSFS